MLRSFLLFLPVMVSCLCAPQAEAQQAPIIVEETFPGENNFTAADGSQTTIDFRRPGASAEGSGSLGLRDAGTSFNFNNNNDGNGGLLVRFQDIIGSGASGQATVINIYDWATLRQNFGGTVSGQVKLNFNGRNFQTFEGFYNVGQADLDTTLTIGGSNTASGGDSSTVVGIVDIHGGRGGKITSVVADGASGAGPDYLFSVENTIKDGAFAFYYNGSTNKQGNDLKIGAADADSSVIIGGRNSQAAVRLSDLIGGDSGYATSLLIDGEVKVRADTAQNTLNIINNNAAAGAVILENVLDGVLNLGGTGSNIVLQWVNAAGEGLQINSLDNGNRSTVEAGALANESGISSNAKIILGNAALKLAENGSGLNSLGTGSRFSMDSTRGRSILDASQVDGDFSFGLSQQPTLTVGGGGHVIIENNNLSYTSALESASGPAGAERLDGRVAFDTAGENRLIFFSRGRNSFEGGLAIDDRSANIEFAGSSFLNGFTEGGGESRLAGQIYFTGLNDSADPLEASRVSFGNGFIDMRASVLHLNNSLLLSPASGHVGGLGRISRLLMGDGAGHVGGESIAGVTLLDTSLSADAASIGPNGAQINAAVAVGGFSPMENSLNILGALEIGGKTVINGHLATLANGGRPAFHFTANESIQLTDAAIFSSIDPGTIFTIDQYLADQLRDSGEALRIFEAAAGAAEISRLFLASLAANLTFDDSGLEGFFDLDPFGGGTLRHSQSAPQTHRLPMYARPMLAAAALHNPLLGQYIRRGPELPDRRYYQEVAQIMGGAMNAALNMTHTGAGEAMRRLRSLAALAGPVPAAGNPAFRITDGLWLNTAQGRLRIDENYRHGFGGLRADSSGLTAGYDLEAKKYLRAGFFAGFNTSEMKSDWQKIESESVEAGLYGQLYLPWDFIFNAAVSYSWQNHQSHRQIDLRGTLGEFFTQKLRADFSGDSLNVQAELKRPFKLGGQFQLTPSIGYIYQGTLLEPFLETSDKNDPSLDLSAISGGTDFNLHQIKTGAESSRQSGQFALNARAHWLQNLGDLRPESQAVFAHSLSPKAFTMYGAELDRHMLNLGLGIGWKPEDKPISIGLDYEGLLGDNTQSHSLNLNISYNF